MERTPLWQRRRLTLHSKPLSERNCPKDQSICPGSLFSRIPAELWLLIGELVDPVDRICLKLSCRHAYSTFKSCSTQHQESVRLSLRLRTDWMEHPAHRLCVLCLKAHTRFEEQPRIDGAVVACHPSCTDGITLSVDCIICQLCWTKLILEKQYRPRQTVLQGSFAGLWHLPGTWKISWRGAHLVLQVQSVFLLPHGDLLGRSVLERLKLLRAVSFCPCLLPRKLVIRRTLDKVAWRTVPWWKKPLRGYFQDHFGCCWCGAVYVLALRTRHEKEELVVTRFHNLSSATTFAYHAHFSSFENSRMTPGAWMVPVGGESSDNIYGMANPDLLGLFDVGLCAWLQRLYWLLVWKLLIFLGHSSAI